MKQYSLMLAAALALTATAGFAADGAMMEKKMDKGMDKAMMEKPMMDMPMDVSETMMKHEDGMMMNGMDKPMEKAMDKPMDGKMEKKMMHKDKMMKNDKTSFEEDKYSSQDYNG